MIDSPHLTKMYTQSVFTPPRPLHLRALLFVHLLIRPGLTHLFMHFMVLFPLAFLVIRLILHFIRSQEAEDLS